MPYKIQKTEQNIQYVVMRPFINHLKKMLNIAEEEEDKRKVAIINSLLNPNFICFDKEKEEESEDNAKEKSLPADK